MRNIKASSRETAIEFYVCAFPLLCAAPNVFLTLCRHLLRRMCGLKQEKPCEAQQQADFRTPIASNACHSIENVIINIPFILPYRAEQAKYP